MADRRALCTDLRIASNVLGAIIEELGQEDGDRIEWMTHSLAATAAMMTEYADDIEAEELER